MNFVPRLQLQVKPSCNAIENLHYFLYTTAVKFIWFYSNYKKDQKQIFLNKPFILFDNLSKIITTLCCFTVIDDCSQHMRYLKKKEIAWSICFSSAKLYLKYLNFVLRLNCESCTRLFFLSKAPHLISHSLWAKTTHNIFSILSISLSVLSP